MASSAFTALAVIPALRGQPQALVFDKPDGPRFEVVSIKPAPPLDTLPPGSAPHMGLRRTPASVNIGRWSIRQWSRRAHGLWPSQLIGPEWMDSARFDI